MPIYHQLGEVPRKRHVAFRKEDGGIHHIGQGDEIELAVMVDTFRPLLVSQEALPLEDEGYPLSWLEGSEEDQ